MGWHERSGWTVESTLNAVRRIPLWQRVASELRRAIIERQIGVGEHLAEPDLAERMGVSRGPIREALRQLELEGLVESRPSGRMVVVGLTRDGIADLFDARLCLELHAVARAAGRITADEVRRLQRLIDEMESCASQGRASRFIEFDMSFHEQFFVVARNRVLTQLRQTITPPLSVLIETELLTVLGPTAFLAPRVRAVNELHQAMLEAVARSDREGAQRALRDHLDGARDVLLSELVERNLLAEETAVTTR